MTHRDRDRERDGEKDRDNDREDIREDKPRTVIFEIIFICFLFISCH